MTTKKLSNRARIGIVVGVVAALIIVAVSILASEKPIKYDESLVANYSTGVVKTEWEGYTALAKLGEDGSFLDEPIKVVNFTDMHLDAKVEKNVDTMNYFIKNIAAEKPDLVTITGDLITSALTLRRTELFAELMEELNVYWAFCLGNHEGDNLFALRRSQVVAYFSGYEHCLITNASNIHGYGNSVIQLLGSDGKPYESLYFIDSHSDISNSDAKEAGVSKGSYDYIREDQIEWYKDSVADINSKAGKTVKSTMFIHIPLIEYQTAYDELVNADKLSIGQPTENGTELLFGSKNENICASEYNSGMFDAILAVGSTEYVIAGHDHVNNFTILYKGVQLVYAQPSGYSTYSMISKGLGEDMRGCTVITYNQNGEETIRKTLNSELEG